MIVLSKRPPVLVAQKFGVIVHNPPKTPAVDSREGEFTKFTIRLPRTHRIPAEAAS